MTLAAQIAADTAILATTGEHGASVTYTARGGSPKIIVGFVRRNSIGPDGQMRSVPLQMPELWIPRNATTGIAAPTTFDMVSVPEHPGGASVTYRVAAIIPESDPGLWHLRLVK